MGKQNLLAASLVACVCIIFHSTALAQESGRFVDTTPAAENSATQTAEPATNPTANQANNPATNPIAIPAETAEPAATPAEKAIRHFSSTPDTTVARHADFFVDFRWDNSVLDQRYMKTGANLRALADSIASIDINRIDSLNIFSYSSPEGRFTYNQKLSQRRAAAMKGYISEQYPELLGKTRIVPDGESWHLFRERVLSDSTLTDDQRQHLLSIIDSPTSPDQKKLLLKSYDRPLWNRIVKDWFVDMRRSFIRLSWTEDIYEPLPSFETVSSVGSKVPQSTASFTDSTSIYPTRYDVYEWKTILALKTNLLYDAVTALNFELEVPIGERWSLAVEDVFPWWAWGPNDRKYCFQMWEIGFEPRWWFARTPERDRLSGHFLGVYGMSSRYDFQWDTDLCWQGEYWSAGLSYGFALPIGKVCNLELSASVGFLRSDWRHYQPDSAYEHLYRDPSRTGVFSYFGPTKLKVSLVVPIQIKYRKYAR